VSVKLPCNWIPAAEATTRPSKCRTWGGPRWGNGEAEPAKTTRFGPVKALGKIRPWIDTGGLDPVGISEKIPWNWPPSESSDLMKIRALSGAGEPRPGR
jgi:hypothetical protein